MTKRINLVHLIAAQRGQALRSRVNQTCTALSAWKVRFIPSPAPLGAGSVACAAVPWRCLCEILGSAHARGAGALGCSPEQADPKAWPSCTAAQPLILLNPGSLGLCLPLLSHFPPLIPIHCFFPLLSYQAFPFTLLSPEFTPIKSISFHKEGSPSAAAVYWVKYTSSCLFL